MNKILICDDEEGVRESLKLILGDYYELILTTSGEQCLECLRNSKDVKLVLLDIKMPQVNGLEILKEVKAKHPDKKVIIITGYKSVETATEAVRLGASGYIVKPFKAEEILGAARKNLSHAN
ncbi:MAG: response regulator [Candidatus Omnitrophota bacterium]|nr:response regulator [Candidatus Omnitrophota bacterium]